MFKYFENIAKTKLINYDNLKWCYISNLKLPLNFKGEVIKLNEVNNFLSFFNIVEFYKPEVKNIKGLGIQLIFSKVSAIDIDKCFTKKWDIESGDERAKYFLEKFKEHYIEFSFSGTGLRILLNIDNFNFDKDKYYIKNSKQNIEFYNEKGTNRYVSITGKAIYNNDIKQAPLSLINEFLDKYMLREINKQQVPLNELIDIKDNLNNEDIKKRIKVLLFKDKEFYELWYRERYNGSNESELDFILLKNIIAKITRDISQAISIFESSPYFQAKDNKHLKKWYNASAYYQKNTIKHIRRELNI